MDFQEFIQNKANELASLDWPDNMILSFIDGAEQVKNYFGWHPASEPPNESGVYVVITDFYSCQTPAFATYDKDKGWDTVDIEWWTYPPK